MDSDLIFRYCVLTVVLILLLISWVYRKNIREMEGMIRGQEEGWSPLTLRLVIAIPLFVVLLLNIFYPRLLYWSKIDLPFYLRMVGMAVAVLCIPLLWWVLRSIGKFIPDRVKSNEDQPLIASGPYRVVRHPLYASALLLLISISLVFGDWIIFGYCIVGLIAFRLLVIPAEEKQLLDLLGEDYECYQSRAGALFPWIRY